MDKLIKIAADSIETLRQSDVFRVLEQNDANVRAKLAAYIIAKRPDLANEVAECLEDL